MDVLLPTAQKSTTAELAAAVASPATATETILVIEDEEGVRDLIGALLTDLGYTVLTCAEPVAALEMCQREGRIDLLVTDLILPQINGTKLAESVLKSRPEISVLYVSGYAPEYFSERQVQLPGGVFLGKPFTREMLAAKVREAIGQRRAVYHQTEQANTSHQRSAP